MVYFTGFLMGLILVSLIMSRRAARDQAKVDPWLEHNAAMLDAGAEPLPKKVPGSIQKGLIIDYGELPAEGEPVHRVWLLRFEGSYPNVRIVEDIASGELRYMAADQIKLRLAKDVDVTELKPMLDELGLRLRMFNRKEKIAVLGVLHTGISAVPDTIQAIEPWSDLIERVEPDWILFKGE
ncbi:hypothetical protein [Coraliomargarita sinensis]|nr:hypothetical protein [Coraliomargarita sinensis]